MKRFQEDLPAMNRQAAVARRCRFGRPSNPGRFRKRHALDCGNARCGICHSDKFPKRTKREHEVRADLSFREQTE